MCRSWMLCKLANSWTLSYCCPLLLPLHHFLSSYSFLCECFFRNYFCIVLIRLLTKNKRECEAEGLFGVCVLFLSSGKFLCLTKIREHVRTLFAARVCDWLIDWLITKLVGRVIWWPLVWFWVRFCWQLMFLFDPFSQPSHPGSAPTDAFFYNLLFHRI